MTFSFHFFHAKPVLEPVGCIVGLDTGSALPTVIFTFVQLLVNTILHWVKDCRIFEDHGESGSEIFKQPNISLQVSRAYVKQLFTVLSGCCYIEHLFLLKWSLFNIKNFKSVLLRCHSKQLHSGLYRFTRTCYCLLQFHIVEKIANPKKGFLCLLCNIK